VRAALPAGAEALAQLPPGGYVARIGTQTIKSFLDVSDALLHAPAGPVEIVTRDPASTITVDLPAGADARGKLVGLIKPWLEPEVGAVTPSSPAEKGGLKAGDRIVAVNGAPVATWDEFVDKIQSQPGKRVELQLQREGSQVTRVVTPEAEQEVDPTTGQQRTVGKVGIQYSPTNLSYEKVGFGDAIKYGWQETWLTVKTIFGFLRDLVTGHVSPRSVGSIVTISQTSGQAAAAGLESFLQFIALFSVNLAVLNLLPIPVLDGGHLLFLAIEGLRGKALSVEQRLKWSNVGFFVVMAIMLWALSNDFLRLFGF
jgi:regulator of sigma E protease